MSHCRDDPRPDTAVRIAVCADAHRRKGDVSDKLISLPEAACLHQKVGSETPCVRVHVIFFFARVESDPGFSFVCDRGVHIVG